LFSFDEISVTDLQRFFKDPIKWYFNKALSIYFREEPVLLADTEVFTLEGLESLQIKKELLHLEETEYEAFFQRKSKLGELPLKNTGRQTFHHFIEAVRPMKNRLSEIIAGTVATPYLIDINIDGSNIKGKINNLYGTKMVDFSDSKTPAKNVADNFLSYLIVTAQGLEADFYFIPFKNHQNFNIPAGTISTQQAIEMLTLFISYFKSGFQQPFLFWPSFKINPFELFEADAATFVDSIEKMRKDKFDFTFKNEYMIKAYENAFFSEPNFDTMKANTIGIFETIEKLMPGIINK
jgi:exodeoxyribonuclease V gamma subunit